MDPDFQKKKTRSGTYAQNIRISFLQLYLLVFRLSWSRLRSRFLGLFGLFLFDFLHFDNGDISALLRERVRRSLALRALGRTAISAQWRGTVEAVVETRWSGCREALQNIVVEWFDRDRCADYGGDVEAC